MSVSWATDIAGKRCSRPRFSITAGAVNRLTRPDEGNTVTDFDDEEIARKFTISTAVAVAEWKKTKINLLDTPGFNIFIQDTRAALRRGRLRADRAWTASRAWKCRPRRSTRSREEFQLPHAFFINKLDRERADFERALENIHEVFGRTAFPIQLPIGCEKNFKGIVDLISMKAYTYTPDGDGKGKEGPIPADMADAAKAAHDALVEMIAEGNDELMEEFFEKGTLPEEHMIDGAARSDREGQALPGSVRLRPSTSGSDLLLNFLVEYFPSAVQHDPVHATAGRRASRPHDHG